MLAESGLCNAERILNRGCCRIVEGGGANLGLHARYKAYIVGTCILSVPKCTSCSFLYLEVDSRYADPQNPPPWASLCIS